MNGKCSSIAQVEGSGTPATGPSLTNPVFVQLVSRKLSLIVVSPFLITGVW